MKLLQTLLTIGERELFVLLATEVTGALKPAGTDKPPLDAHIERLMLDPHILVHLSPTPRGGKKREREEITSGDPKIKKVKSTPTKKSSLPAELEGLQTKTKDGKPMCWHFDMDKKCSNPVKKGRCKFGFHNCMKCGFFFGSELLGSSPGRSALQSAK